jgi:hypothetical protein
MSDLGVETTPQKYLAFTHSVRSTRELLNSLTPTGKVYGLIICLSGLFNFLQTALDALTHQAFYDNPIPVNIMLLSVALVVGTALTLFVWRESEIIGKGQLQAEAEAAVEQPMPSLPQIETRDYGTL